jgi:hypothetical protein
MPQPLDAAFRLDVLNPGGNDPEQHFDHRAARGKQPHAPVNFHAYAACTGGSFFRDTERAAAAGNAVLLLLRGDLRAADRALDRLLEAKANVAVSLKETGLHQVAEQLEDKARLERFLRIVRKTPRCLAPTGEAADVYRFARGTESGVSFIPTPYPLHDPQWNFSKPNEQREGILVGTREWDVPSRNHAAAVLAARHLSELTGANVTIYNEDGWSGTRMLRAFGFARDRLTILKTETPYVEYLGVIARHRLVLELDTSFVPGQVAGDALLCRVPCVGGNGAVDRLGHPTTCGAGRSGTELMDLAKRLLVDREFYAQTVADSQRSAAEHLSFSGVAQQLEAFFRT